MERIITVVFGGLFIAAVGFYMGELAALAIVGGWVLGGFIENK